MFHKIADSCKHLDEEQLNVSRSWRDFRSGLLVVGLDETICTGEMLFNTLGDFEQSTGGSIWTKRAVITAPNVTCGTVYATSAAKFIRLLL